MGSQLPAVSVCPGYVDDSFAGLRDRHLLIEERGVGRCHCCLKVGPAICRHTSQGCERRQIFPLTASNIRAEVFVRMRREDGSSLFGSEKTAVRQGARCGARREFGGRIEKFLGGSGRAVGELRRGIERRFRQLNGGVRHAAAEGEEQSWNQCNACGDHMEPPGFARYVQT